MIIDPYRFAVAASSPWIAGQIGTASNRLVAVSSNGVNWSSAPTYATGLTSTIPRLYAASGLIIASAGAGPRVSLDGGVSWSTPTGLSVNNVNGLTKSGSYWVASGSTTNGIYRSIDGLSWTAEDTTRTFEEAIVFGGAVIVGSTVSTYQRSTDDGDTWSNVGIGTTFGTINFLAKTSSTLIATTSTSRNFVRRSTTGTSGSWSSSTVSASAFITQGLAADESGSSVLLVDNLRNTYYSTDSGASWTAGATIGTAGDATTALGNVASFGAGAWMIRTYDATLNIARIWRATSPAGPWAEVGTFTANGAALGGVRYIGT